MMRSAAAIMTSPAGVYERPIKAIAGPKCPEIYNRKIGLFRLLLQHSQRLRSRGNKSCSISQEQ